MKLRNQLTILLTALTPALGAMAGTFTMAGSRVSTVEVDASSGLQAVFVCLDPSAATLTYRPDNASATLTWMRYSRLGGGYAETLTPTTPTTLSAPAGDMGYIVEEDGRQTAVWVINYGANSLQLTSLTPSAEKDCGVACLDFAGNAAPLVYYTVNGRQMELSRELTVDYTTLEFDETTFGWVSAPAKETVADIAGGVLRVPANLCASEFTLSGDRFLREWGMAEEVVSPLVEPYGVDARAEATQTQETPENQSGGADASVLGGSAPAVVDFRAAVTDGAVFREWQFSTYQEFDDIDLRIADLEFSHTFDELGTTYVRFVCDNAEGSCQYVSQTFEVAIGESSLLCPNAFSPGVSEGVNDEWRVSYRSIVSFECSIYNRSGQRMITFKDPAMGWDGRYHGKLVPAGVYYYTIKALGADGKEYKLSGDINIVNYK